MWFRIFCIYVCMHITLPAFADVALAGSVEATLQGKRIILPSLTSDYDIAVSGDVVNVRLTQTFANPYSSAVNARYLFPLNKDAAVHALTLYVGGEVVQAEIAKIEQAKQKFSQAKAEGKAAALLEQHRPNMFTQRIANLVPEHPVKVVIEYSHLIPKVDGGYELVVPMVVGPRFQPAGAGVAPTMHSDEQSDGATPQTTHALWSLEVLPDYPVTAGVHIPAEIVAERVSMTLALQAPLPLSNVHSDTHRLSTRYVSPTQQTISFADSLVRDNKDFVLRYDLAAAQVEAGLLTHWENLEGGYFSLLIEPPANLAEHQALAREMVFLLDCSGSMSGPPMAASKRFMRHALQTLRPQDSFRIIRFSDTATSFSQHPLAATPANIMRGLQYTDQLYGGGGTMMESGIRQALGVAAQADVVRNVVFLTDGYIGNEASILKLVKRLRGSARLYAFGVGTGVNRYLLDELGRVGRGFTRYYDPTQAEESLAVAAKSLAERLQSPVLTDLSIDWGDLPVSEVMPTELPDLYMGDTVRVHGRFSQPSEGEIEIRGSGRGHSAVRKRSVALTQSSQQPAIRRIWARQAIKDLSHYFTTPLQLRPDGMTNAQIQARTTELGLRYDLVTRWTAFVAVSKKIYNTDPQSALNADVALPKVAGVTNAAYSPEAMTGYAAPEPGVWLTLMIALGFVGWRLRVGKRGAQYR